ncbi:unnamed protein product [Mytilus coruscus]|uniref:CCHC-type domain-containing protein n=1 Tax=Mytilus coruscus TaxID=42192 RepID=A0A6J8CHI7_MYTCO|nr:unnamed protein product [Mytilus coruscus]
MDKVTNKRFRSPNRQKQNYVVGDKSYSRDCTVRIERLNTNVIKERLIIEEVETITGLNTVLAVVQHDASSYDVTMDSKHNALKLLGGVSIGSREYSVSLMHSDITVVSVMKLPSYVPDEDIRIKLAIKGVNVVSPIYRRTVPGTQVADGTRFMRCKFPPGLVALPWTIPFKIGSETKYFRLKHNNQTKVCSECSSPDHMKNNCPHFECYGCGEVGHSKRYCKATKCKSCSNLPLLCVCTRVAPGRENRTPDASKNCKECEKFFCNCKCSICGNKVCTCVCLKCELYPCVCSCMYCHEESCVCPCQDCERQPCECKCDNCLNLLKDCTCMDQNIDGDKDKNDESEVVKDDDAESSENTNDDEQTELKKADDSHMNVKTIVAEVHVNSGGIQEDSRKRKLDRDEHIFDDGSRKNKRADSDSDEEVKKKKNEECSPVDIVVTEECNVEMATEEHSIDIDDEYSTLDDDEEVIVEGASSYTESLVCSDVELNTDCKINDSGKEKCISETFWDDGFIQSIKHMYEGDIYYSNGTDGRQGVAVLASKYYKDKIKCIYKDDQGRFIHVTYHENDTLVNFVSLYAPNVVSDRGNFFDFVIDYTKDLDNLIIGGDFNTSLSVLDRGSKTCHMNDEPYRKLTKLMDDNNLYDIWRARNPDCRIFSWKRISEGKLQQSRIDYFLVSRNMSSFVQSLYNNVTSMSDHSFVIMNLNCTCIERGPGLWVLNNTLLFNEEYVQRVKDIISQEKRK